jgi:hypothetical protein
MARADRSEVRQRQKKNTAITSTIPKDSYRPGVRDSNSGPCPVRQPGCGTRARGELSANGAVCGFQLA